MKARLAVMVIGLALAASVAGAGIVSTNIYTYLPAYRIKAVSNTTAAPTLATNTAYICIPVTNLPNMTAAQAVTNGDFRRLVYALTDKLYESIQAITSTNRPTLLTITRRVLNASDADVRIKYEVEAGVDIGSLTVPSE
jgi:hypothetical protein